MEIFLERENKMMQRDFEGTARQLLEILAINPETVLIARNDTLITADATVTNSDKIILLSVISGG